MEDPKLEAPADVFGDMGSLDGLDGLDEFENLSSMDFIDEAGNVNDLGNGGATVGVFNSDTKKPQKADGSKAGAAKRSEKMSNLVSTKTKANNAKTQFSNAAHMQMDSTPRVNMPETSINVPTVAENNQKAKGRSANKYSFPERLFEMLDEEEAVQKPNPVISWLPHGRAFMVNDPNLFAETIMPKYFSNVKRLSSFRRQLNIHGFRQLTKGADSGAYCHELFLRGHFHLSSGIVNLKRKPQFGANSEPNFYKMPPIGEKEGDTSGTSSEKLNLNSVNMIRNNTLPGGDKMSGKDNPGRVKPLVSPIVDEYPLPPKTLGPSIMYSSHPLDQVNFFIPLNMLYGAN